jgi:hypothetical protein
MLTLFDPAAIPEDYDRTPIEDLIPLCDKLEQQGRLKLVNTGGDGSFLLHAYEEEQVPENLRPYLQEPIVLEKFQVPTGRVYLTGTEYVFAKDDSRLRKYPGMGGSFPLKPGVWHLTLYRTEYPDDFHDKLFAEKLQDPGYRLWNSMGCFVGAAVLAFVATIVSFFFLRLMPWSVSALPLGLLVVSLPFIVGNSGSFRRIEARKKEIEREYPSIVAVLKPAG